MGEGRWYGDIETIYQLNYSILDTLKRLLLTEGGGRQLFIEYS